MPETITLNSQVMMTVSLSEPMPPEFAERPGLAPALRSVTIAPGVNRGIDPEVFQAWKADAEKSGSPLVGLITEISPEDAEKLDPVSYGFEPGLEKLSSDAENTKAAAEGSTVKASGPAKASDMAATSNTPNDDSPRGDPALSAAQAASQTATPATAKVAAGK